MFGRGLPAIFRARTLVAMASLVAPLGGALAQAARAAQSTGLPPIRHVFVIVLENKDYDQAYRLYPSSDPYLSQTLPSMGALIPYYFGTGHSSADNYISMVSGQPPTADTKNDCDPAGTSNEVGTASDSYGVAQTGGCWYPATFPTVADQLVQSGFSWRAYIEGMQGNCSATGLSGGEYAEKHNPFPYFASLLGDGQCAANDVPLYPASDTDQSAATSNLGVDLQSVATTPELLVYHPERVHRRPRRLHRLVSRVGLPAAGPGRARPGRCVPQEVGPGDPRIARVQAGRDADDHLRRGGRVADGARLVLQRADHRPRWHAVRGRGQQRGLLAGTGRRPGRSGRALALHRPGHAERPVLQPLLVPAHRRGPVRAAVPRRGRRGQVEPTRWRRVVRERHLHRPGGGERGRHA